MVFILDFVQFGQMLYLVVQTMGLFHESQRYDRDNYITILSQNVFPENSGDLGIISQSLQLLDTFGLPYDYASLMQFPSTVNILFIKLFYSFCQDTSMCLHLK